MNMTDKPVFDRTTQDIGNIVEFGHGVTHFFFEQKLLLIHLMRLYVQLLFSAGHFFEQLDASLVVSLAFQR
jgi:hypothetical protein